MRVIAAALFLSFPTAAWAAVSYPAPVKGSPAAKAIHVLSERPRAALVELRALYRRYGEVVQRRSDDGWQAGLLSGDIVERPEEPVLPVRQLEEALARAKGKDIRRLRRLLTRPKGTCLDWSDAVWAQLLKEEASSWSVRDQKRASGAFHTAAVLCTPSEDPALCLAFDPWARAQPDVFEFTSWDRGSEAGRIPAEFMLHHLPEDAP